MPTTAVLVLSFMAYATGAVMARRLSASRCSPVVHSAEVFFVTIALIAIRVLAHPPYSAIYLALCIVCMNISGALLTRVTLVVEGRATAGTREFEEIHGAGPRSTWQKWLSYSRSIIDHEIRLVLVACYMAIIGPFAIAYRLFSEKAHANMQSTWTPRNDSPSLESARRPF